MEPEAYSDQLIGVLRQMRPRAIEDRADPELVPMLLSALAIVGTAGRSGKQYQRQRRNKEQDDKRKQPRM